MLVLDKISKECAFLNNSHLPSPLGFLKVLSYYGTKRDCYTLLTQLHSNCGIAFFYKNIYLSGYFKTNMYVPNVDDLEINLPGLEDVDPAINYGMFLNRG